MHLKYISKSFKKSLFEQMYSEHPDFKKSRREKSEERRRRRRNSSEESDCKILFNFLVADRTSEERRRVIAKWNNKYEMDKDEEKRKREAAEAKINFILLQQRLQEKQQNLQNKEN
jgi:hypothetical protein